MRAKLANKVANVAGDGTTTTIVLPQPMARMGLRQVAAGANPMELKRSIEEGVDVAVKAIGDQSRDIETTGGRGERGKLRQWSPCWSCVIRDLA